MSMDFAYYQRGVRQEAPASLDEALKLPRRGGSYIWIEADDPTRHEMHALADAFDLHELAVEDAGHEHQRPKVEAYDDFYFLVFRTARLIDGQIMFGELDLFIGVGYVIAVRHGAGDAKETHRRLERRHDLLQRGPAAVVWGALDVVVDEYIPVVEALDVRIDELEGAIFGEQVDLTQRIYDLQQQISEVFRAVHPLLLSLDGLEHGAFPELADAELRRYFRDIADHARAVEEEVRAQRIRLNDSLAAHLALLSHVQNMTTIRQNRDLERLTIVATIFLPLTFVTGFFGMNFGWMVGHIDSLTAFVLLGCGTLVLPLLVAVVLYLVARRRQPAGLESA
jgi:magnesium transporter